MLEEYFTSKPYGSVFFKRVLFEGFLCWYEWDHANKRWIQLRGVTDERFRYINLKQIKKSDMFIHIL